MLNDVDSIVHLVFTLEAFNRSLKIETIPNRFPKENRHFSMNDPLPRSKIWICHNFTLSCRFRFCLLTDGCLCLWPFKNGSREDTDADVKECVISILIGPTLSANHTTFPHTTLYFSRAVVPLYCLQFFFSSRKSLFGSIAIFLFVIWNEKTREKWSKERREWMPEVMQEETDRLTDR